VNEHAKVTGSLECPEAPDFRVRLIEYPKDLWQSIHTHEQPSVTLVLSGAIEEQRGRGTEFALPFSLIVKAAGIPHSDRFGPMGCKTLQINLPREFDLNECEVETSRGIWHNDGGSSIRPLLGLVKCAQRSSGLSASDIAFSLYEALDAIPNKACSLRPVPNWIAKVKHLIDDSDPLRPLSMATLQRQVEIHPVHLTRQFKRQFGCTIREYMQYRRIRAAATLVAQSSMSLTEVAYRCAFADQAHFCRAFRAVVRLTARDYRKLTEAVGSLQVEKIPVSSDADAKS
jgi:AraC family transcriptional regulator